MPGVQATPDGTGVLAFCNPSSNKTIVSRLDASLGSLQWSKTLSIAGVVSCGTGIDFSGNVYIGTGWGGYTVYKYDPTVTTQAWHYSDFSSAFEYPQSILTDTADNVYVSAADGSGSGGGSKLVKFSPTGSSLWSKTDVNTSGKDLYDYGMALASNGFVYRVGADAIVSNPARTDPWLQHQHRHRGRQFVFQ